MRVLRLLRAIAHPITEYQVTKAKNKHRKKHPVCRQCGLKSSFFGRKLDVHHKLPVHVNPDMACEPENFVTLCRPHHFKIGHLSNWKDWNVKVMDTISALSKAFQLNSLSGKRMTERGRKN